MIVSCVSWCPLEMLGVGRMLRGSGLTFVSASSSSVTRRGLVLMLRRYLFLADVLGVNLRRDGFSWEIGLLSTFSRLCLATFVVLSDSLFLDLNRNLLFVFGTNFDPLLPNDRGLLTTLLWSPGLLCNLTLRILNLFNGKWSHHLSQKRFNRLSWIFLSVRRSDRSNLISFQFPFKRFLNFFWIWTLQF